jgi:hypothetical protein
MIEEYSVGNIVRVKIGVGYNNLVKFKTVGIQGINGYTGTIDIYNEYMPNNTETINFDDVYPVTLHGDLLVECGWTQRNASQYTTSSQLGTITWNGENKNLYIDNVLFPNPICNVHQMQNLFRIVGLDDLAHEFNNEIL